MKPQKYLSIVALTMFFVPASAGLPFQLDYVFRDVSGNVQHVFWDNSKWYNEKINNGGKTPAPSAVGDLDSMGFRGNQLDYVYRDANGGIQHVFWFNNAWYAEKLNNGAKTNAPAAAGNPKSMNWNDYQLDYVYRDVQGNIQHIFWQNNSWYSERVNNGGTTNAPAAAGDPAALNFRGSQIDYVYRDIHGYIQHVFWNNGVWYTERLNSGGKTNAPLAVGDPCSVNFNNNQLDYVYRDGSGNIQHIFWNNGVWYTERLNNGGKTNAPVAAGNPCSIFFGSNQLDYVYRDGSGNIQHIFWNNGVWYTERLNNGGKTNALKAVSDPTSMNAGNQQLDYTYIDGNGDVQHIFWVAGKWYSEIINNGGTTYAPSAVGKTTATFFTQGSSSTSSGIPSWVWQVAEYAIQYFLE